MSQTKTETPEENTHDTLFSQHANAAWGIAFVTTEAVSAATDAVADGFAELFQTMGDGNTVDDPHHEVVRMTLAAAIRITNGTSGEHARQPVSLLGETKDRRATLALAALSQPLRSTLWLIDAERFSVEKASAIVQQSEDETTSAIREARSQFRRNYVEATRRDRLSSQCTERLDLYASYADGTLDNDSVVRVDTHLEDCDPCRSLIARLVDLESRLRAAIPTIPAWTRQYVNDTWDAIYNAAQLFDAKPPTPIDKGTRARLVGSGVAGLIIVVAIGLAYAFPGDDKAAVKDSASTHLPAPTRVTTTLDPSMQSAVATPELTTAPAETTTTSSPAATAEDATGENTAQPRATTTTSRQRTPTTAVAPSPTPATTQPPADDRLVDLPPTPVTTTSTTTASGPSNQ